MSDIDYLRARVSQEDRAARAATSSEAEAIHRVLAATYARRAVAEIMREEEKILPPPPRTGSPASQSV